MAIFGYRTSMVLASMLSSSAFAADAGSITRDIEKNIDRQQHIKKQPPKLESVSQEDNIKTTVKSFKFIGNTIVPTAKLESVVASYVGKELGFNALQKIVAEISDYYASQGGLAKVYLPKQDITNGVVSIAIIEGKLNSVIIDNKDARLSSKTAENYIYSQNPKNTPIKNKELSRALMNLNDLGGLKATSSLAPGAAEASSDLVVKLKDGDRYSADVGVDNYGSKSTGFRELNGGFIVNNLSKSDMYDNLNVRGMMSEGVRFARVAYNAPVGYHGDKVGAVASAMTYRLVNGSISGDGYSTIMGLTWNHPFVRTKAFNINLSSEADLKKYHNIANSSVTSDKKASLINSILSLDKSDNFMGGGQTNASVGFAYGILDLKGDMNNYAADSATSKTNGNYLKYSINLSRQQSVSDTLTLQASLQAQSSNKNLDSSEELSLGGSYGVRAYPTSEASGDSGYLASLELKYAMSSELIPSIFTDYGRVIINKNKWSCSGNNSTNLGGYGIGVNYATSYNLNIKAQISKRLATKYNPNSNDTNSDGSKTTDNRYWLSATYFF